MKTIAKVWTLSVSISCMAGAQASKTPPATPLTKGIAQFDAVQLEQAKATLTPIARAGDPEALYYLGRIAIEQSKADSAVDWLQQAIKAKESVSVYHQWLGSAYTLKMSPSNPFAAMSLAPTLTREWNRAIELDSTNIDARANLVAFDLQAPAMMGGGVDKAREQVAAIMRLNPYQGRLQDVTIDENQKDTVAAETKLRDLVKAFPDSSQPVVRLALFYVNQRRYDDAFALLEGRLKKTPTDVGALYQLGRVGAVSGLNLNRSQTALNQYLKQPYKRGRPTIAAAHWRLGMVLEAKGDKKTARTEYETALKLDPSLAGAKASLDKLK